MSRLSISPEYAHIKRYFTPQEWEEIRNWLNTNPDKTINDYLKRLTDVSPGNDSDAQGARA